MGFEFYGIALIPLIMGLSEVFKRFGMKAKFIPIINIILGIGAGFFVGSDIKQALILGLFLGLSSSGLYSGVKNVRQGVKGE